MRLSPKTRFGLVGLCSAAGVLLLSLLLLASLAFPVLAGSSKQNGRDYPTPTAPEIKIDPVPVQEVGGQVEPVTYPAESISGIEVGETVAVSNYPDGATFTVAITSEQVTIDQVTFVLRYPHGSGTRARAERGANENEWVAALYTEPGNPPWQEGDFFWRIFDTNGNAVETTSQRFVYSDPTRVWFMAETPLLKLYWFGYDEDFAQVVMRGMEALQERWLLGFGSPLSYQPLAVVFSDPDTFGEFSGGGAAGQQGRAGFTSDVLGITVQRFQPLGIEYTCPYNPPPEQQTVEWLYNYMTEVITHEVTHLYQFDKNVQGPIWFTEGSATWFSLNSVRSGPGLRDHVEGQDIPTLQGDGPGGGGAIPNGCNAPGYWMGSSFINWMYGQYGMAGIGQWFDLISRNVRMDDALIAVTGKTLAQLEPEWRAYLGYPPEPFIRPTEPYRFPPTMTPFGQ